MSQRRTLRRLGWPLVLEFIATVPCTATTAPSAAPTVAPTSSAPTVEPTPHPTRAPVGYYEMAYYLNEDCDGDAHIAGEYLTHEVGDCYVAYARGPGSGYLSLASCEDKKRFDLQICNSSSCDSCVSSPRRIGRCLRPDSGLVPVGSSAKLLSIDCPSGKRPPLSEPRTSIGFYADDTCSGNPTFTIDSEDFRLDFCKERWGVLNCPRADVRDVESRIAAHCVDKGRFLQKWRFAPPGVDLTHAQVLVTYEDEPGFFCKSSDTIPNVEYRYTHLPSHVFLLETPEIAKLTNGDCARYWEGKTPTAQEWEEEDWPRRGSSSATESTQNFWGDPVLSGWMKVDHGVIMFPYCDDTADFGFADCPNDLFCPGFDTLFTEESLPTDDRECTTTTTSVTTSTVTVLTTTTTSTSYVARRCENLCETNGHPWYIKCVWAICSTCLDCTNVLIPAPAAPPPLPARTFTTTSTTSTTTSTSTTVTTTSTSRTTPPPPPVTTATTEEPDNCRMNCYDAVEAERADWGLLCTWDVCWGCGECEPTSTTSSSSTTTSTSVTTTTSTSCKPALCSSDWNQTVAQTRTTTTATTTTTSTTTTTTTWYPCMPPSQLYPIAHCTRYIQPGELCVAETIDHPCVEKNTLVFSCPSMNRAKNRPPDLLQGEMPKTRCRVCDLHEVTFNDTDPRQNLIRISFSWGPNSLDGFVDESGITSYQVWYADACGRMLMRSAVAEVPVDTSLWDSCCTRDAYSVSLVGASLPHNFTSVHVMVVPVVNGVSLLSVGQRAGVVVDYFNPREAAFYGVIRTSAAERCGGLGSDFRFHLFRICLVALSLSMSTGPWKDAFWDFPAMALTHL